MNLPQSEAALSTGRVRPKRIIYLGVSLKPRYLPGGQSEAALTVIYDEKQ